MGWLKDLGTSIGQTVGDVVNETVSNTSDIYSGYVELFGGESKEQIKNLLKEQGSLNDFSSNIMATTRPKSHVITTTEYEDMLKNHNSALFNYINSSTDDKQSRFEAFPSRSKNSKTIDTDGADILGFKIPDWTYADFINERAIFQKNLFSMGAEPGWFYFKLFFNFDTQYGLLGGLLNDDSFTAAANSAAKYLYYASSLYVHERPNDRIEALHKFASILSFINTNTPWFFKSVKGLNNTQQPLLREFSKEKSIEIECATDSVDMRLNTLMDLYKFAVYDDINCKEIIPENLRKFDLSVVIFETPIRYYHTSMKSSDATTFNYKSMSPIQNGSTDNYDNVMSFKLYTFVNCEIDPMSLGNMVPGDVKNEQPFQMGSGTIKIKYDRVYQHTMNEFNEMLFGSDGFYYNRASLWSEDMVINARKDNETNTQDKRYRALQHSLQTSKMSSTDATRFKKLVDASEAICGHNLLKFGGNILGNLAGIQDDIQIKHFDDNGNLLKRDNGMIPETAKSDYFKYKLRRIKEFATAGRGQDISILSKMGASYLLGLLGSSYDVMSSNLIAKEGTDHGFLAGYANTGLRRRMNTGVSSSDYQYSQYYKDKLRLLHKKDKPGIVNFGSIPQNKTSLYISGITSAENTFYGATLLDRTLTAEWDTRQSFIVGSDDKQVNSVYFKQKLHELNDGVVYTLDGERSKITKRYIDGAEDKQVNSEYYDDKLDAMNDGVVNTLDGKRNKITKRYIDGAEDKQLGSDYHNEKLNTLVHGGDTGNTHIAGSEDKQVGSAYQDDKLTNLVDGAFRGKYITGAAERQVDSEYQEQKLDVLMSNNIQNNHIAGSEDKQVGSKYYDDKLNAMNDGEVSTGSHFIAGSENKQIGSIYQNDKIYDTREGTLPRKYLSGTRDKQIGSIYNDEKLDAIKKGTIHKEYIAGSKDRQVKTAYQRKKLEELKDDTVDVDFISGAQDKQVNTMYNDEKLNALKSGTFSSEYISGHKNTQVNTKYYKDKLRALNDGIVAAGGSLPSDHTANYINDPEYESWGKKSNQNVSHLTGAKEHEQIIHSGTGSTSNEITEYLKRKIRYYDKTQQ